VHAIEGVTDRNPVTFNETVGALAFAQSTYFGYFACC